MADTVFRVEVGAQIAASTQRLKEDIQNILNDISKAPPQVTLGVAKTTTKRQIQKDLNELFQNTANNTYGITLGLKGGGNIRGSTGKAITKDLLAITSTLSQQQAAKVTVHIDTAATQKAMLAELKKLDLGVAITANGGSDAGESAKQAAKDQTDYNAAVKEAVRLTAEAATLEKQALSKGVEGAAERRRQAAENRASAESVRDAYLQTAEAAKNGVTASGFDKEVQGHHQVASAIRARTAAEKDLLDTQKKASDSSSTRADAQQAKAIDSAKAKIQTLIGRLNMSSSAGVEAKAKFEALSKSFDGTKLSAAQMNEQIRNTEKAAKDAGAMAETAGEKFSRMLGTKIGYAAVGLLLNQVRNGLRQVYTNVVELDTGMTELKKVTDETDATYQKFLDNAASRVKTLGSTMSNVVNATASFARLGYSLSEASELADAAVVYAHVGDEVESIDDASNSVISTMQAFGVEADNVMSIVDKFNQIGNTMPVSSGGAGEAMQRSAAAMAAAGNTIDETLALIASMNSVIQNPETVGTTLKTLSMYLRASKTEAEAAGESTDGMAGSVSKLRDEIKSLTGNKVDIMADDNTYKSSFQILRELSQVWDQLSDVSQANILEKLAGKRNANAVSALLTNFDLAEKALLESQNAAGSAMAENEKYLDSINGKLDQLKASWEQLSANVLDSEVVKGAIDLIKGLIEILNKLDEATGGASSSILAGSAALIVITSVLSAFKLKVKDGTSILGTLFGLLSSETRIASVKKMADGIKSVTDALKVLGSAQKSGANLWLTFTGIATTGGKIALALTAIAVAIGAVYGAYKLLHKDDLGLDELQEQSAQLKEEVDELSSSVETANDRITELQKLADAGTISLTEQDELNRLKAQNELLESQLALKQALLEAKQDETQTKAQEDAAEFFAESDYTGADAARNVDAERHKTAVQSGDFGAMHGTPIELLDLYRQSIQYCDDEISRLTLSMADMSEEQAKAAQERIDELKEQRTEALKLYSETAQPLEDILSELDPSDAKDAELIKKIKNVIYQMQMLSGDATALKSVFDDFWSDETTHEGITEYREELERAANAQRDYNEELKQYGGNVDLTNRPHVVVTQEMADQYGDLWPQESVGSYSTVNSITYSADELGLDGTQAILVTPILPDGTILGGYEDVKNYLTGLFAGSGTIDVGADTEGIIMGVFDEGSLDASIQKAGEVGQAAHEANAAFHDLLETDTWTDFETALTGIGLSIDDFTSSDLAAMFETWAETADDVTASLTGLTSELDTLVEKSDLLKSAQDDLSSSGTISSSTLSSIVEKFPALEESVALYIAGMKTGKELISDLSDAYQADVSVYKDSIKQKLALSPTFFENLTDNQKQLIDDLAESYQVDLGNFKTVEEAKLNFQAQIIAKLASNYSKYAGASLAELKQYQAALQNDLASGEGNSLRYQSELNRVNEAIAAIEGMQSLYDSLIGGGLEGWDPSKYSSTTSSSDSYKTSVQEKVNALKHQLQMEKITAEQYYNGLEAIENQYYKDSAAHLQKYADEIRSIDEELFNGRRELNEDWLNDQQDFAERAGSGGDYTAQQDYYNGMFSKLQEMIKAAKDYGLDEASDYVQELYDKVDQLQGDILASVKASFEDFESYMDDFDLWKGADFSKLDWLKHELNEIIALYDKGQLSWAQYTEARNEIAKKMYDTQRDSLEEILELTMDMIKAEAEDQVEAIDDQVDAYQRLINKKKELLQDTKDEADHEEEVAEKVKEIAELQSKIAQLSLDDSREATAKKSELEVQLAEKQKELAALQKDYALDQTLDALDKTQEAFEDEKEAEKDAVEESVDSWQKLYEKAIKRIEGNWDGLYSDLLTYSKEHRDSIDGPDSLVTAWKNATSAMQEYNNSFEDAYNNISDISINPNANQSSEAQAILQKMQTNSALANALGKSVTPDGRNLHEENEDLAQQYYELTGQKLVYDNGWRLDNASGQLAYDHSSSTSKTNSTTQTTTSNKNTSSTGEAYEATKAKFGDPPTGSTILQQGSTGAGVKWLQYYLKQAGFLDSSVAVDGQFYSRTEEALKKLQRAAGISADGKFGPASYKILPKFHVGGIVGDAGSINDTEVLALLKKGEWVLDDTRKQNLKAMFATLKEMTGNMMSSSLLNRMQVLKPTAAFSGGDTFAPQINVSIQHNGSMTDKDAKKYGDMVANTALDQLKSAFAKRGKR